MDRRGSGRNPRNAYISRRYTSACGKRGCRNQAVEALDRIARPPARQHDLGITRRGGRAKWQDAACEKSSANIASAAAANAVRRQPAGSAAMPYTSSASLIQVVQSCARGCAATRCEASANHHGKIRCAVLIVPEGIDKNGAQFRLHRMAVAGGTHAKKRFHAASALRSSV
jgi:hypothetical protein